MAQRSLTPFNFGGLMTDAGSAGDPFRVLRREMDRLFEDALRGFGMPALSGQASAGQMMMPRMDVTETDSDICIRVDLPGVSQDDVDVTLDDDVLTIRGERKAEQRHERQNHHVVERSFGAFQRSVRLPFAVQPEQVQASFENGVLTVTLPKTAIQQRSRRIEVRGGGQGAQQIGQSGSQGGQGTTQSGEGTTQSGEGTTQSGQGSSQGGQGGAQTASPGGSQTGSGSSRTGSGGSQAGGGQVVNAGDGTPGTSATQGMDAGSSGAATASQGGGIDQSVNAGDGTPGRTATQGTGAQSDGHQAQQ